MSYQGARAQPHDGESRRVYEVSRIRLDLFHHIREVLWCEIDSRSDHVIAVPQIATVSQVIEAIHSGAHVFATFEPGQERLLDRQFAVVVHSDGRETITLEGGRSGSRELTDMARIEG